MRIFWTYYEASFGQGSIYHLAFMSLHFNQGASDGILDL